MLLKVTRLYRLKRLYNTQLAINKRGCHLGETASFALQNIFYQAPTSFVYCSGVRSVLTSSGLLILILIIHPLP